MAFDHRPVSHLSQSPMFNIFFSVLRSEHLGDRCSAPELEWVAGVCLSTLVTHSSDSQKALVVVWSPYHRRSVLALEAVVSRSSGSGCGQSGSSSSVSRSASSAPFHRHHQGVSRLALHAWRLSSDSPKPGASPSM